ncbi:MAG: hypothetical protein EP349_01825 [Alphaproteobacteria bacterium]|nr:MAG: hypothetical protein EP349_01825 [Alphaproteobacteria bacterium]
MDYEALYFSALATLFPDSEKRKEVEARLSQYGTEDYHREIFRVRLAVLKLAEQQPEKLPYYAELACIDYRDVLSLAEYPETIGKWSLKEKDPARYQRLSEKERQDYLDWVSRVTSS